MAVEDRLKISSDGLLRAGAKDMSAATPYDPPEHATAAVSPAEDIWALGVTLVEVLTQHRPSNGIVPADLPEPFAGIARGCLLRNPADRSTIPQISKLLAPTEAFVIPRKKRYTPIGVVILLVLVVITVAGVMIMQTNTNTAAPTPVKPTETLKTPEPQASPPAPEPRQTAKATKPAQPKEPVPAPETVAPATGILEQPLPDIMDRARNTIHGRVKFNVRVDVDPSGAVTDAKLESTGASKYFSERALAAVRKWKFEPASVNGSQVGQRWRVHFEFLKTGTKVQPQRLSP
jgi:TonB family protein